jgi:hypothetical protein
MGWNSKTDALCDCGVLAHLINEQNSPVELDEQSNLIMLNATLHSKWVMYHCFSCGGAFPDNSKKIWIPKITLEEFSRMTELANKFTKKDSLLESLRQPDYQGKWSSGNSDLFDNGKGEMMTCETYEYYKISELMDLEFVVWADGKVNGKANIKSLSPRHIF